MGSQKACNAVWDRKSAKRRTYDSWRALLCWQQKQARRHHGTDTLVAWNLNSRYLYDCPRSTSSPLNVKVWHLEPKVTTLVLARLTVSCLCSQKVVRHTVATVGLLVLWTWWWGHRHIAEVLLRGKVHHATQEEQYEKKKKNFTSFCWKLLLSYGTILAVERQTWCGTASTCQESTTHLCGALNDTRTAWRERHRLLKATR